MHGIFYLQQPPLSLSSMHYDPMQFSLFSSSESLPHQNQITPISDTRSQTTQKTAIVLSIYYYQLQRWHFHIIILNRLHLHAIPLSTSTFQFT